MTLSFDRSAEHLQEVWETSSCSKSAVERCRNWPRVLPTK